MCLPDSFLTTFSEDLSFSETNLCILDPILIAEGIGPPIGFSQKKNFKVKSYLPRDPKLTESSFHFSESSSCRASWLCLQKISKRWPSHSPLGLTNLIVVTRIKLGIVDASVHQTSSDCGFLQIRWCKHFFEEFFLGANKICQSFCKQKYMYCIWSNSMTSISPSVFWVKPRFFLVSARHRQIGSNGGVRPGTSCFWHTSFVECWEMGLKWFLFLAQLNETCENLQVF